MNTVGARKLYTMYQVGNGFVACVGSMLVIGKTMVECATEAQAVVTSQVVQGRPLPKQRNTDPDEDDDGPPVAAGMRTLESIMDEWGET